MNIKGFIEWIGHDLGSATATVFPYLLFGLVGLYVLYLILGYLRVSQVGIESEAGPEPVLRLPSSDTPAPAGAAYGLSAPRGARRIALRKTNATNNGDERKGITAR